MTKASAFGKCKSPVDLMRLARAQVPSDYIAAVHEKFFGRPLTAAAVIEIAKGEVRGDWRTPYTLAACIGRRGRKTSGIVAWCVAFETLCVGHEQHAQPGSRIHAVIVAPEMRQAKEAVREVRVVLDQLKPLGVQYVTRESGDRFEIQITRPACAVEKVILVLPASEVSVRGFAVYFAAVDEAGFLPNDSMAKSGRGIVDALRPGMLQFPVARLVLTSTPGAPEGLFHEWVTTPPTGAAVVRAPTWVANPAITEQRCREMAHDDRHFDQEFQASRFGAKGEKFLDGGAPQECVDPDRCDGRTDHLAKGQAVVAIDVGQVRDATGFVVASTYCESVSDDTLPITHVLVHVAEQWKGSLLRPLQLPKILDHAAALSRSAGGAPVLHDPHNGVEVARGLAERGVKAIQCAMSPAAQEKRWRLVAGLIKSKRLHIPDDPELVRQLQSLRVTQLPSGALKVGAKRDDLADCVALAVEHAVEHLEPAGGGVWWELSPGWWNGHELVGKRLLWFRRGTNGEKIPTEPPLSHWSFEQHAKDMLSRGLSTPAIERWKKMRDGHNAPRLNVPVINR